MLKIPLAMKSFILIVIIAIVIEKAKPHPLHSPNVNGVLPPQDVGGEQAHWSPLLPPANPILPKRRTRRFVR